VKRVRSRFRADLTKIRETVVDVPHKNFMMCLNESTLNPFEILSKEIIQKLRNVPFNRYFNSITQELLNLLSHYVGLDKEYIMMGNGADEMLYYTFVSVRENKKDFALSLSPSYFDYKSYSGAVGLKIQYIDLNQDFDFSTHKYLEKSKDPDCKLAIICNPNNPTGNLFPKTKIIEIIENCQQLVLVDETYFEFSGETLLNEIDNYRNLIVVRSFSKAFSAAGLRFGYLLSHPDNIKELKKVKTVFNLNLITQAIGTVILENQGLFQNYILKVIKQREKLFSSLSNMPGLTPFNTKTNFLIFKSRFSKQLYTHLQNCEIAIRAIWTHPVLRDFLRVTVSKPSENKFFYEKTRDFMLQKV